MQGNVLTIVFLIVFVLVSVVLLQPHKSEPPPDPSPYSSYSSPSFSSSESTQNSPLQSSTDSPPSSPSHSPPSPPSQGQISPPHTPPPYPSQSPVLITQSPTPKPITYPPTPTPDYSVEKLHKPSLAQVCEATQWQPDIYLSCNNIHMGTFNAINRLQVCIRWAIDLGAGFIYPVLNARGQALSDIFGKSNAEVGVDYLLDEPHLWESLKVNCPKLKIVKQSDLGKVNVVEGVEFVFKDSYHVGEYRRAIMKVLATKPNGNRRPIIVHQKESICGWRRDSEPIEFQIAYRDIFRFNPVFVAIADSIIAKLPAEYEGVHLRMEDDAKWFKNKEHGMDTFLDLIKRGNRKSGVVAYVACGDETQLTRFTEKGREGGIEIVHKWKLMTDDEKNYMKTLSFDQMALIDWLALEGANHFYGVAASTFSYSLAQARHLAQFGNMDFYVQEDTRQRLLGDEGDVFFGIFW